MAEVARSGSICISQQPFRAMLKANPSEEPTLKKRTIFVLALLALSTTTNKAAADPAPGAMIWEAMNGKMLIEECRNYVRMLDRKYDGMTGLDFFQAGQCEGAIAAAEDTMTLSRDALRTNPNNPIFCKPSKVTRPYLAREILKFGSAHPEIFEANAQYLIRAAVAEEYPCPKTGSCAADMEKCG